MCQRLIFRLIIENVSRKCVRGLFLENVSEAYFSVSEAYFDFGKCVRGLFFGLILEAYFGGLF